MALALELHSHMAMRTSNLDTLLSELDVLPHYVDDPSRSLRLALALLAVLLLLLMLLLPTSRGESGTLFSAAAPSPGIAKPSPALTEG